MSDYSRLNGSARPISLAILPETLSTTLLAMLVLMLASACRAPGSDEEQILKRIEAMTEAIELGEVRAFMRPVADDFIAAQGGMDRNALRALVFRERLARESIRVRRANTDISLTGAGRATASFNALATGGSGLLPDEARLWRIETGWRYDDGEWMLISASWAPATAG